MADIVIYVSSRTNGKADGFRLSGDATVSPGSPESAAIAWETADIAWKATAGEVNQAIQDAAVAAAVAVGHVIVASDNKFVIGGAAGVM